MKEQAKKIKESINSLTGHFNSLSDYNTLLTITVKRIKSFEIEHKTLLDKFYYDDLNLRLGRINGYNGLLIELETATREYKNLPKTVLHDIQETNKLIEQFYTDLPSSFK